MKNKKNSNIIIIITLIVIVGANSLAILWFNNMVFSQLEEGAKTTLKEMASEERRILTLIFDDKESDVVSISDLIVQIGNSPAELSAYMPIWEDRFDILNLIVADMQGIGLKSNGEIADISSGPFIELARKGETAITDVYMSEFSGEPVLSVIVPIYYEETIQAIIVAEYSIQVLTDLLISSTDSRGYTMILNRDAEILMHTYPFEITFENFMQAEFEGGLSYEKVIEDFSELREGSVTFSINGDRKFSEYLPVERGDLILFFETSESELSGAANSITVGMISVSISLALGFFFLVVYILWSRKDSLRQIEQVAFFDELTGLSNQVKLKMDVGVIIKKGNIDVSKYVLIKLDIANFKAINEVYGFEVGNKVICGIADTIREISGSSIKSARVGTDEFMIFAQNTYIEDKIIHEKIFNTRLLENIPEIRKHIFNFRYGRYYLEKDENNVDDMFSKASMAHSYAKSERDKIIWNYDEKFKQHIINLTELTNKMDDSLLNGEFKLFLQPKYRLEDEKIVGAEALVRWIEPDGKVNYPNEFLPLFEKNGFIIQLDKYMFEKSCESIRKQIDDNKSYVPISVNFSRLHLKNQNFIDELVEIVDKNKIPHGALEIELTETTIMEDDGNITSKLQDLRNAGFLVSVDDFGSGYSSLGMLKDYKVDVIKLDRSFFEKTENDDGDTVVEGIVKLVNNLGPKIIAEGIETLEQVEFLKSINCYAVQGYYFAKPMPCEEFEKLLLK